MYVQNLKVTVTFLGLIIKKEHLENLTLAGHIEGKSETASHRPDELV